MDEALTALGDPNVAFILFAVGLLALLAEVHAQTIVLGVAGAVALLLAIVGFSRLPVDLAGVALIVVAIVLFVLELNLTSHGLLGLAGIVCFALGASMLYRSGGEAGTGVAVSPAVIVVMVTVAVLVVAGVSWVAVRSRRTPPIDMRVVGEDGRILPVGARGRARTALAPAGVVDAGEESWSARSADGRPIEEGAEVHVTGADGLTLLVERTGSMDRRSGPTDPD